MTGEENKEKKGVIGRYLEDRGFGFLQNGVFFHRSGVNEELRPHIRPGLEVNYVETQGEKGPVATITSANDDLEEVQKFNGDYKIVDVRDILLDETVSKIRTTIGDLGVVLVPAMHNRFPESFGEVKKHEEKEVADKIQRHLEETFETAIVVKYDLFSAKKKPDGTEIIGHPFLQEMVPFLWLIRKSNVRLDFRPREK